MAIWDSKCVQDITWLQDTRGFQDIYRKIDSELLVDSIRVWNGKCVWDII